jgi:hypothetical protein
LCHHRVALLAPLYFLNFFNEWWGFCLPPLLGVFLIVSWTENSLTCKVWRF